jgi:hypothetical protein
MAKTTPSLNMVAHPTSPRRRGEEKQPLHARVTKVSLSITHWPTDFFQTAR